MDADDVLPLLYTFNLSLSSQDDYKILTFFEKKLDKIKTECNFLLLWYPEADVAVFVKLTNKLWIYINMVTCFIGNLNFSEPTAQLNLVLNLAKESCGNLLKNPLVRIDMFYNLIMRYILSDVVSTVWKILLSNIKGFGSLLTLNRRSLPSIFRLGNFLELS